MSSRFDGFPTHKQLFTMIDVAEIHLCGAMLRAKFEPLAKEIFTLKKQLKMRRNNS
jgi:hypothetical protein